jgi:hypothetical protein
MEGQHMNPFFPDAIRVFIIGIGATALMDLWLLLLKRFGVTTLNFAMIGRWAGHMARGRFRHDAIAKAGPVRHELALGWLVHYASGIGFSIVLAALYGSAWLRDPGAGPAFVVGIAAVAAPWFLMQPAMGAGIASSRTPTPLRNCLRSLANHTVFGFGLYLSARAIA